MSVGVLWATVAAAEQPTALVNDLGNADPAVRAAAAQSLAALGVAAREAVLQGLKSPDAEIRRRCRWLIEEIEWADLRQRRARFVQAADAADGCGLPGWQRFHRIAGAAPNARELFAAMIDAEPALMMAIEAQNAGAIAGRLVSGVSTRMQGYLIDDEPSNFLEPARMAAFWHGFVALADLTAKRSLKIESPSGAVAAAAADVDPEDFFYQLSDNLLEEEPLDAALTHKQFGPGTQRLVGAYLDGLRYDGETAFLADRFLALALRYRMPEGIRLSASVLRNSDSSGESRAMAIVHLAIVGGKPYASLIEKQLASTAEVFQNGERARCEVRDVALVWLIHLTGQSHDDYSLTNAAAYCEAWMKMRPADFGNLQTGIAVTEAQRRTAKKKWQEYAAKHPLPEMPKSIRSRVMPAAGPSGDTEAIPSGELPADPPPATEADSDENTQPADERPPDPRWPIAQRESVRLLAEADDLVARRQYSAAARIADELLSLPPLYYAPGRGRPLWCELHRSVERAVLRWPTAAHVAYLQRTSAEAADELVHAVRRGRADEIAAVAHRWLHTPAGAEALWLLAHRDLDRGDWLRGLLRLEQLKSTSISAWRLEPSLTLRMAQCHLKLGMRREAEALLRSAAGLLDRSAALATAWAAEPPRTLDELCRRLEDTRPTDDGAEPLAIESLKFLSSRIMPWLREQPQPISEPPAPLAALINDRQRRLASRNRPTVPMAHPLLVNNVLLHRTPTHLEAVEWPSGRIRWRQPLEDRLQHYQRLFSNSPVWTYKKGVAGLLRSMVSDQSAQPAEINRKILLERIEDRVWRDGRFAALSSDGRRAFSVENDSLPMPHDYQRFAAAANGRRFIEGMLPSGNLLAAYDLATGKLLWEVGNANVLSGDYSDYINLPADNADDGTTNAAAAPRKRATGDPFGPPRPWAGREGSRRQVFFERPDWSMFSDLQFLGPPLPMADRLYVAASSAEATYLLELAPEDGRLHWALMLEAKPLLESHFEAVYLLALRCAMAAARAPGGCVRAEGVLVCHDGDKFFGVDLAQRRTVWAYPLTEFEASAEGEDATNPFEQAMQNERSARFDFVWSDPPALAVGPYVLLAPGHQKTLDCLRAADGRLCWSMPRREGLYVGAITADRVVIVERGGVRCLKLDDGRLLWRRAFPQGATPVGRGYQLAGRLLVPLRDVGVPAFDLDSGRIIGWQRTAPQTRLGNLIPAGDSVLLHTAAGLFRCDDAFRAAEVAQRNAPPAEADAPTRCRHVELLLAAGEARQALGFLRALPDDARREEHLHRLTLAAAIDAVRSEPAAAIEAAAAVLSEATKHNPDEAQPLAVAMADGYEQLGRRGEAFQLLFVAALAQKDPNSLSLKSRFDRLERVEAARQVAFDRLVSPRLEELYRAAERAEQAQIDRFLSDALAAGTSREAALRLAPWHPAAADVFVEQARAARQSAQLHEAEWSLAAAVRVATEHKTELEAERRTVQHEGAPEPLVWPEKFAKIEPVATNERSKGDANQSAAKPIEEEEDETPFAGQSVTVLRPVEPADGIAPIRIAVDQAKSSSQLVDSAGRPFGTCAIGNAGAFGVFGEFATFDGFGLPEWHAYYLGRLAIVSSGSQVTAFDLLRPGDKPLWSRSAETAEAIAAQAFFTRGLSSWGQRTRVLAVSRSAVCTQLGQRLAGIEPHTGRILWQRDDLPYGCDLFGDDEVLFATPPSGENTFVFDPRDGSERQMIDPIDRSERFTTIGRNVVYWRVDGRRRTLVCVDALSGKTRWTHRFGEQAHIAEVDPLRAAVLDLDGAITIVSMTTGRVDRTLRVDPLDKIESFMVLHGTHGTDVLISKTPLSDQSSFGHWRFALRPEDIFSCGFGQLYHFDPQGRRVWHVPLKSGFVFRNHPVDAPVLVLVEVREGRFLNLTRQETRVTCFDRRDGSVLFEKTAKRVQSVSTTIITAKDGSEIEVRSPLGVVRFRAAEPDRPADK